MCGLTLRLSSIARNQHRLWHHGHRPRLGRSGLPCGRALPAGYGWEQGETAGSLPVVQSERYTEWKAVRVRIRSQKCRR